MAVECCDEKVRKCVPKLVGWLTDHMENCILYAIATNQCPICNAPPDAFGELHDDPFPSRAHAEYARAFRASDILSLRQASVKNTNNALWHITGFNPQDIVKPDILHTLYMGMLVHLMKWIFELLTHLGRATTFDHLWSRLPPYLGFTPPNKAYRSVTQWTGKEMRNLLKVVLGVFTASLSRTSGLEPLEARNKPLAHKAILCVRYLTNFMILNQYRVHTAGSIQFMFDYLQDFHKHKEVFLHFRAGKQVKSSVREATRDLQSQHRSVASDVASSHKRRKLEQELQLEREERQHDLLSQGAHFNFPKMHLISHFAEQIPKDGSLLQYSTEICEASHKALKQAYWQTNHINILPQIIDHYTRTHNFSMKEQNIAQ